MRWQLYAELKLARLGLQHEIGGSNEEGDGLCFRPGRAGHPGTRAVFDARVLGSAGYIDQALLGNLGQKRRVLRMAVRRKADRASCNQDSVQDTHRGREFDKDYKGLQFELIRQIVSSDQALAAIRLHRHQNHQRA